MDDEVFIVDADNLQSRSSPGRPLPHSRKVDKEDA